MNWFTKSVVAGYTPAQKQKLLEQDSGCEHVEQDINLAYVLHSEKDSFGPVGTHLVCKACDDQAEEEEGNEERVCCDCKQTVKRKDGGEWRWYDFYAPQGDVPLFICNPCRSLPKHLQRVARDLADYNDEFGFDDNDD